MEATKPAGKRPRAKYDAVFRLEAVRRVSQDGQAATCIAQALGISEAVLVKWVRAPRAQATRPTGSEVLEQEDKQLRAQLAHAEMERAMLKKALTIFSQPTARLNASSSLPYMLPFGPCASRVRCWCTLPQIECQ